MISAISCRSDSGELKLEICCTCSQGYTIASDYLSESELISLMEKHGIGTYALSQYISTTYVNAIMSGSEVNVVLSSMRCFKQSLYPHYLLSNNLVPKICSWSPFPPKMTICS
ncbi:unnamed protein product [Rhodiola kirilowii]